MKDSGLLAEAQALLDDENATQAQLSAMEMKLRLAYTSNKNIYRQVKELSSRVLKRQESDYTKASWHLYETYAKLMGGIDNEAGEIYGGWRGDTRLREPAGMWTQTGMILPGQRKKERLWL